MLSRNCQLRELEREVCGQDCQQLLECLKRREPSLGAFASWPDAVEFLLQGPNKDPGKDAVLRPILELRDSDPRRAVVLLFLFWRRLGWVYGWKQRLDPDATALWSNVTWVFMRVVEGLDVTRRRDRLIDKVINDVVNGLSREYRRSRVRSAREVPTDPQDPNGAIESDQRSSQDRRLASLLAERRLRRHLAAGRLSEADFFLLCGTYIYNHPLADCARELGLTPEAAKKRRQRAMKRLRPYEIQD